MGICLRSSNEGGHDLKEEGHDIISTNKDLFIY